MNNYLENLKILSTIWQIQLNMEYLNPKKNVRLAFKDIGPIVEFLALDFFPDFKGTGSGGMGYDLINLETSKAIEVKSCCTIQNSNCMSCKAKFNPIFSVSCPICGSMNVKSISDSRFGINSDELLRQVNKGIFENLTLCHIFLKYKNASSITLVLKWYTVDFKNSNIASEQLDYFKTQSTSGKKPHCNLIPESFDFYKLCPKIMNETEILLDFTDLNIKPKIEISQKNSFLRVPEKICSKKYEKDLFKKLDTYDSLSKTSESFEFTKKIPFRKKTHGKVRGDTRGKIDSVFNT